MAAKVRHIKNTPGDYVFEAIVVVLMLISILLVGYPLLYILSSSLSSTAAVRGGRVWIFPVEFTPFAYEVLLGYKKIWTGYGNTILYTAVGTAIGLAVTIMAAYPLFHHELKGKRFFSFIFLFTMLFSGGLIPTYLWINQLGMIDSLWGMVLPGAVSAWNIMVVKTYFTGNIQRELLESATIDGCSDIGTLVRIVLPLSGAIIAVISLFYAVGLWNSYFSALIYLRTEARYPLQIFLREILIINNLDPQMAKDIDTYLRQQGFGDVLKFALIVVSSVPLLVIYPFLQRYFISGVMIGSIKG